MLRTVVLAVFFSIGMLGVHSDKNSKPPAAISQRNVFLPFVENSLKPHNSFLSILHSVHLKKYPSKRTVFGIPKIHLNNEHSLPLLKNKDKPTSSMNTTTTPLSTTLLPGTTLDMDVKSYDDKISSTEPNLEVIEAKLRKSKENKNGLLLAISLLHHHGDIMSAREAPTNTNVFHVVSKDDDLAENNTGGVLEKLHERSKPSGKVKTKSSSDSGGLHYFTSKYRFVTTHRVFNDEENSSLKENNRFSKTRHFEWFVLILDGNCCQIRHRMNTFVRYLKATLAAKLVARYDDIYVPSVLCDNSFMVNVSLDVSKYPDSYKKLHTMADMNTTLLEISGEIFYLEKVLSSQPAQNLRFQDFFDKNYDMKIVLYVTMGCMTAFILISVITIILIKICYQRQNVQSVDAKDSDVLPKQPQVIYSPDFSHFLDTSDQLHSGFSTTSIMQEGVAPHQACPQSSFGSKVDCLKSRLTDHKLTRESSRQELLEELEEDTTFLEDRSTDTDGSDC